MIAQIETKQEYGTVQLLSNMLKYYYNRGRGYQTGVFPDGHFVRIPHGAV